MLDLNKDVNQYLKRFQIENPYSESITLANLMTQTDSYASGAGVRSLPYVLESSGVSVLTGLRKGKNKL
ncbi:MAG: hypothetical protein AB1861_12120 [Cyanobacteriota bacterium]